MSTNTPDSASSRTDPVAQAQALFGPQTLGRYVVLDTLGSGGMGTVLRAFDRELDRPVALKVLHGELDDRHTTRLRREAQAMAKLSHPNVVQVYEVGRVEGRTFVAMELVKGQTLGHWIEQDPRPGWRACVELFLQLGAGLAAAHEQGLVHRDFKPGNAIIDEQGRPRVLDFGLARRAGVDETNDDGTAAAPEDADEQAGSEEQEIAALEVSLTRTGSVLGTPAYMPPEQMKGLEADARSDQFSFCVSLYEALYGERPYEGTSMVAMMVSMMSGAIRPAPRGTKVPAALRKTLLRGLAIEPDERWPSMEALLERLRQIVAPRTLRRIVGAGAVALAIAAGVVVRQSDELSVKDEQLTDKEKQLALRVEQLEEKDRRLTAELAVQRGQQAMLLAKDGREVDATRVAVEAFEELATAEDTIPTTAFEGLTHALTKLHQGVALRGHDSYVVGVALSPDGRTVATASWDKTARLWDARTGALLGVLEGHVVGLLAVAFSADGARLGTASVDGTSRIWDIATGRQLDSLPHDGPVWDVAFSPDGRMLATTSGDDAWVRSTDSDATVVPLLGHSGLVRSVAFSADGTRLVTASEDQTARVWDARSGAALMTLRGHDEPVLGAAWSPDGTRIATASRDRTARLWDATSGEPLASLPHDDVVYAVAWSPDGARLATASWDDEAAHLWDVDTGRRLASFRHANAVVDVAYSSDGRTLATASWDQTARSWDLDSDGGIVPLQGHSGRIDAVAVSPDGSRVVTGGNTVRVWDARTGAHLATLRGHATSVLAVAFSADGTRIASSSWDGAVRLWDAGSCALLRSFEGHQGPVLSVELSADGRRMVTAGRDRTARIWDVSSGRELRSLPHEAPVADAITTPDGQRVLTLADQTARIWSAATGEELVGLPHEGPVTAVALSADGSRIVTAGKDYSVRTWDMASGEELTTFEGHTAPVLAVAFSSDGTHLATAGEDLTARVWDVAEGAQITSLPHERPITSVALSPDGTWLATASGEQDARLWTLDSRTWLEWGCSVLDRRQAHTSVTQPACAPRGVGVTIPTARSPSNPVELLDRSADVSEPAPETITVHGVEMVLVPGGTFTMGSSPGEFGRGDHEGPPHQVTLDDFYIARTEVTTAQYALYLDENPDVPVPSVWPSMAVGDERFGQPDQPIVGVSWYDVKAYCDWAGLELPTEAQWEYAARAGTTSAFWFGDDGEDLERFGWFDENSQGRVRSVGSLDPNPLGLHDICGNVWEWCADAYEPYTTPARAGDGLRKRPVGDVFRVIRGGGRTDESYYARSAARLSHDPRYDGVMAGFRPVLRARDAGGLEGRERAGPHEP